MSRQGLVSYGGDSESEADESMSTTPPISLVLPGTLTNSLGIYASKPRTPSSPPSFVKPVVESAPISEGSAPLRGLVAYYGDDEDHNESLETSEVFEIIEEVKETNSTSDQEIVEMEFTEESPSPDDSPTEEHLSGPLFLSLGSVHLPPEPSAPCSSVLQDKVKTLLQKQALLGINVNKSIQERKDFRNPSIYKKLIEFSNLDEFGSNYPEHLYNPHEWSEEDYYDSLSKAQKKAQEKRDRARHERIEFVTGTKRKTKWEGGGSQGPSPNKPSLLGPGPVGAQAKAKASLMKIN